MSDQLLQHAVENVWCNPGQDQPGIIQLSFFRRVRGEVQQRIKFAYSELSTPTKETYDLFFIGQYQISQWGVDALFNEWQSLEVITNATKTLLTVFDRQGYMVHPHDVFLIRLPNARVVAAIRGNTGKRDMYLSHYTNAFFSSVRSLNSNEVWVRGVTFDGLNMQAVLGILTQAMNLKAAGVPIRMFESGVEVNVIIPSTLTIGTPITIMRDDSIDTTTYVDVDSLNYRLSGKDNSRKYVIDIGSMDTIQYHDDIEFRVCRLNADGSLATGLLFHRLQPNNVRMLTESTYSISIDQINHIRLELGPGNCFIAVIARKSGYDRPLIFESSKLHELARLPDNFRQLILTARVPTIKEWSFAHLENSKYVSIMRRPIIDASATLDVYNAYGYNAIAYYLAPHMTFSPSPQVSVPEVYRDGSVVQYGEGITVNAINGNPTFDVDTETTAVEFYQNKLQPNAMDYYNVASIPKTTAEVRFYIRNKTAQDWIDITHAVTWTTDGDTMVHDYQNPLNYWAIRVDGNGLHRQFTITEDRGIYTVPLIDDNGTIELPYKDVVVRVNNRELVQGIDYSIDKQVIWISKKDILGEDGTVVVDVLAEGFPEETEDGVVQWGTPDLYGWTEHGYISYDDTFSLRADKLHITTGQING